MSSPVKSTLTLKQLGYALLLIPLAACASDTGIDSANGEVWQPGDVHADAQATSLEAKVNRVAGEYRELRDRFDALERLYIDLARNARTQGERLQSAVNNYEAVARDPELVKAIEQAETALTTVQETVQKLEDRIFKVEMAGGGSTPNFANRTPTRQPRRNTADNTSGSANTSGNNGTPLSPSGSSEAPLFAVHLTSLRSADQARENWQSLRQTYGAEIADLTPLLYKQTRAGLTILRLLAGPFETEQAAIDTCETLRTVDEGQFCTVTNYQGDPLP